jgi:hypothetical protein
MRPAPRRRISRDARAMRAGCCEPPNITFEHPLARIRSPWYVSQTNRRIAVGLYAGGGSR